MRGYRQEFARALAAWLGIAAALADPTWAQEAARVELPGLLATYRSLADPGVTLSRIEAKPAFLLEEGSIYPRLPPGAFEVEWRGHLRVEESGPFRFSATGRGSIRIEVAGVRALDGRGNAIDSILAGADPVELEAGSHPFRVAYRSPDEPPARVQIAWESAEHSWEPLPPWRLSHRAVELPPAAIVDEIVGRGRAAASRLGCSRCHRGAYPGLDEPGPGPSLAGIEGRVTREWILEWLRDPPHVRAEARMPALFEESRTGFVERWLIASRLLQGADKAPELPPAGGDHRMGRRIFLSLGCAACHFPPDADRASEPDLGRLPLSGIADRFSSAALAGFLVDPQLRYPDGRMPRIPLGESQARDVAAYILLGSHRTDPGATAPAGPTTAEIEEAERRWRVRGLAELGSALLRAKGCNACHSDVPGLEKAPLQLDVPISGDARIAEKGCCSDTGLPRFAIDGPEKQALTAYTDASRREKHPSPFELRRRRLERAGCVRCHQRDTDRAPPIEEVGSVSGGAWLQALPYQRTPRLTYAGEKLTAEHLLAAVRDGVTGIRSSGYSYQMPAFGEAAVDFVRSLAEQDGSLSRQADGASPALDATIGSLTGPELVGFRGYSCIACHLWNGQMFSSPDPGAIGPDLMRTVGRIRREWFDRFLEAPARAHPGTPMPAYFSKGVDPALKNILGGNAARQREALWSYLSLEQDAQSPKAAAPIEIPTPAEGEPPVVAQVPILVPGVPEAVDALCVIFPGRRVAVYDTVSSDLLGLWNDAVLVRHVSGRLRTYRLEGKAIPPPALPGAKPGKYCGYDRLKDGVRVRFGSDLETQRDGRVETLRRVDEGASRRIVRELEGAAPPASASIELPPARADSVAPPPPSFIETARPDGPLERKGYRAVAYPRPRLESGEDLVMPSALAADASTGRVFIASMRRGEIFVLDDPRRDGESARFLDYARGLFQEAYSMLAENGALYVLHRRCITRVTDTDSDGFADRFERVARFDQGISDDYDYGYGLVREKSGALIMSHAPHANRGLPGAGSALRLLPDRPPEAIASGFRNPLGWCAGPEGEVFFTDNQGEWVATNKLCHLVEGRDYGYPNPAQAARASSRPGKAAVWVPYAWAKSVNGVTYDGTGGKFGPFAGQLFLAELMFGGAIVRASLERVNGEYQGACFPFWGKGLLGPLVLAFDRSGSLFVGSITEPGWMSQPDRGALFRIDWTGEMPFEMRTIRIRPDGFRVEFTKRVDPRTAGAPASFKVESYRYEYTGAYGSPELDRADVAIDRIDPEEDGMAVDLGMARPISGRVYRIGAPGVHSSDGEPLVHATGAYTVNEVP